MNIKSESTILVLLTLIVPLLLSGVSASVDGGQEAAIVGGGWRQIKDLNSPEVQEMARFAVTEQNREARTNLEYQRVVNGWTKALNGPDYRLVIVAKDGAVSGNYRAGVWTDPKEHWRKLAYFRKFDGDERQPWVGRM